MFSAFLKSRTKDYVRRNDAGASRHSNGASISLPLNSNPAPTPSSEDLDMPGAFTQGPSRASSPLSELAAGFGSLRLSSPAPSTSQLDTGMASLRLASPSPSKPDIQNGMASLRLDDVPSPGAFSGRDRIAGPSTVRIPEDFHDRTGTEELEMLLTATTLTAEPVDTANHHKLFTSADEFHQERSTTVPTTLRSLDFSSALEELQAVTKPRVTNNRAPTVPISPAVPCSAPGRQFTPKRVKSPPAQPPSPALHQSKKRVDQKAWELLQGLSAQFELHNARILDASFTSLSVGSQCGLLDQATTFLKQALAEVDSLKSKGRRREKDSGSSLDSDLQSKLEDLRERLRTLYAKVCVLYAPLTPTEPIKVDAEELYTSSILEVDQIGQVLILLAVICNVIIGLSTVKSDFIIGVSVLLVKLGMSTGNSESSDISHVYTASQNEIIADMPSSLHDALKRFGVDGTFLLHAACPSCNFTNVAQPLLGGGFYEFPEKCSNDIVGKKGRTRCGTDLLMRRKDGTTQPIKPYLVSSLPDYIARCLADPDYLAQCTEATDSALHSVQTGADPASVSNVFDAEFVRNFKGPDGKLFIDRGDNIHLAFSLHLDFFNPNGVRTRGNHDSIGVISAANLALNSSIRYLPENMYPAAIIPGRVEPDFDENDHYVRPVVRQFVQAWRPGLRVTRTAASSSGAVVKAAIVLSVNDLPAARKVAGLQGIKSSRLCSRCKLRGEKNILDTDHSHWGLRDVKELRHWAEAYRDAQTTGERDRIFEQHGVRWSSLWELEYWDPTRMLVIDAMHCILEGVVHYHCRHVLRLNASAPQLSSDGLKYAYDWPWTPYNHEVAPPGVWLEERHIDGVSKIQQALCLALEGEDAISLNGLWTRIYNAAPQDALRFVLYTLNLPETLRDIDPTISSLFVERAAKARAKRGKGVKDVVFPQGPLAKYSKDHLIAMLLNWRLKQPMTSEAYIIPTGTRETLNYVQKVIRNTIIPSWLSSVPKNYGESKAGSIKADEWRTLATVYLPIALVTLWGDADGCAPPNDQSEAGFLLRALDHTMALFQATTIACRYTMTASRVEAYRELITAWVQDLRAVHPHTANGGARPNIHAAQHIYDFLLLFGPVLSWWCSPFERLIGALQKINTNDHIGGALESTIIRTLARTANLRQWLRRPDCPEAVQHLKRLFDKTFVPANAVSETKEFTNVKGASRAHARYDGINFSRFSTHLGNASIIYRPSPMQGPVAGQIQEIENYSTSTGTVLRVHVLQHEPLPKELYDPFRRYAYFPAKTYSTKLKKEEHVISLEDIISHAARYDYSHGRSVLLNLSRH